MQREKVPLNGLASPPPASPVLATPCWLVLETSPVTPHIFVLQRQVNLASWDLLIVLRILVT